MNYKILSAVLFVIVIGLGAYLIMSKNNDKNNDSNINNTANLNQSNSAVQQNTNSASTNTNGSLPAGQEKVTGSFSEYATGLAPGVLSFKTDSGKTFNFLNQPFAHTSLKTTSAGTLGNSGCEFISGKAEITISNYKPQDTTQSESVPTASLVSVNKITQSAHCTTAQ